MSDDREPETDRHRKPREPRTVTLPASLLATGLTGVLSLAGGGAVGTSIGAGKVDAAMVRLDARLERIEAEQRRAAEATGAAFVDVRAEARELRKQLDELRLWRAEVDARSRAAGAR